MHGVEIPVEKSEVTALAANPESAAWRKFLAEIKAKVSDQTFNTWFQPLECAGIEDNALVIKAPGDFFIDWIEEHFLSLMEECVRVAFRASLRLQFRVSLDHDHATPFPETPVSRAPARRSPVPAPTNGTLRLFPDESSLDPRYTFDTFVIGKSNQMSHAACMAVAEKPACSYNPLFIYGGVGLGKTHLMQAIGNQVREHTPSSRIFYVSSEQFMNEMIGSIQKNRTLEFKNKYRNADLLLIDDIQFLAGKESTQEEFFHTFNALFDNHKQIVMTSDRPPKEIPTLEERLVSRFHWGLVTDIQAPDLETRVAILKRKAEADSVFLPDDVALLIANNVRSNIRELEGSLVRLVAFSSLTKREISADLAGEVLKILFNQAEERPITVNDIQAAVADYFHVTVEAMRGRKRTNQIAFPRQIGMYLCRKLTQMSLVEIGGVYGGRDHTTVIYGIDRITDLLTHDRETRAAVEFLMQRLREGKR